LSSIAGCDGARDCDDRDSFPSCFEDPDKGCAKTEEEALTLVSRGNDVAVGIEGRWVLTIGLEGSGEGARSDEPRNGAIDSSRAASGGAIEVLAGCGDGSRIWGSCG
jgi:hypothetical protein